MKTIKFGIYEYALGDESRTTHGSAAGITLEGLITVPLTDALRRIAELEKSYAEAIQHGAALDSELKALREQPDTNPSDWLRDQDCVYRLGASGHNVDTINVQQAGDRKNPEPREALAERIRVLLSREEVVSSASATVTDLNVEPISGAIPGTLRFGNELVQATPENPVSDEFTALRLRRILKLLNLDHAVPSDDADLMDAQFSTFGMIAGKIERMFSDAERNSQRENEWPRTPLQREFEAACGRAILNRDQYALSREHQTGGYTFKDTQLRFHRFCAKNAPPIQWREASPSDSGWVYAQRSVARWREGKMYVYDLPEIPGDTPR
jgi:hypothetical protein